MIPFSCFSVHGISGIVAIDDLIINIIYLCGYVV
jgi:hypothetical protein